MRLASLTIAALLALGTLPALAQAPMAATAPAATAATSTAPAAMARHPAATVPMGPPVNVNTATAAQLDAIPQIGPKRAAAIIAHRPYKTADELVSKKALSQGIYDKVKARVTAS